MTPPFRLEALASHHERHGFSCGIEALDQYFQARVTQDMRRRVTACYVAVESVSNRVAGFYTLAAADVPLTDIPEPLSKRLPRYPSVPVARLEAGRGAAQPIIGQLHGRCLLPKNAPGRPALRPRAGARRG